MHEIKLEDCFKILESDEKGLTEKEANERLKRFGLNEIKERERFKVAKIAFNQFKSFLVIMLIIASIISYFIGELIDSITILAIVGFNSILGFFQEYKAEKALENLRKFSIQKVKVVRDGKLKILDSKFLVPGDIVFLEAGERVPADCRLISSENLFVDESLLTGESMPIEKDPNFFGKAELPERKNMLFKGTIIVRGKCKCIVCFTSYKTELGKIATTIQRKEEKTPLQIRLEDFTKSFSVIIIFIAVSLFLFGLFTNKDLYEIALTSIALAVAAVPEGLPAIVTITLALGVQNMVKRNSLVRKLSSVEALGSVNVICADKTGTMTTNEMTVKKIYCDEKVFEVSGSGYDIKGEFYYKNRKVFNFSSTFENLIKCCYFCNNSKIEYDGKISFFGDPTEISLLILTKKFGKDFHGEKIKEIEFTSERKMMSVIIKMDNKIIMFSKGAPEIILEKCSTYESSGKRFLLKEKDKKRFLEVTENFSSEALRCLGLAYKYCEKDREEKDLTFLGIVGIIDPPREEVKDSIKICKDAGIEVKMITGDHKKTAISIAKQIGLVENGESNVIEGREIEEMSEEELAEKIDEIKIFARVSPLQKVKILEALKKKGYIVAMTGDGINDAPSLKIAHVGVSMGKKGTDIAKDASDIVLLDDNFTTIVNAVEEGRNIFLNIKKFVKYLLSANFGEVFVISLSIFLGFPLFLLPLQILWINLITDGLPALALAFDPKDPNVMRTKTKKFKGFLKENWKFFLFSTLIISLSIFAFYQIFSNIYPIKKLRTIIFTIFVIFELFLVFNCRYEDKTIISKRTFNNKYLLISILISLILQFSIIHLEFFQNIFETEALSLEEWLIAVFFAMPAIFIHPKIFELKFK